VSYARRSASPVDQIIAYVADPAVSSTGSERRICEFRRHDCKLDADDAAYADFSNGSPTARPRSKVLRPIHIQLTLKCLIVRCRSMLSSVIFYLVCETVHSARWAIKRLPLYSLALSRCAEKGRDMKPRELNGMLLYWRKWGMWRRGISILALGGVISIGTLGLDVHAQSSDIGDDFESIHGKQIGEMVRADIWFQIAAEAYDKRIFAGIDPSSLDFEKRATLSTRCFYFADAKFYSRYRGIIDNFPINEGSDLLAHVHNKLKVKSEYRSGPASIDTNPLFVVVGIRQFLDTVYILEGFHPPIREFAIEYAHRDDLERECRQYLEMSGLDE
jgi:hypothetical protein